MRVSIYDPITLKQGTIYTPSNTNDLLTKSLYDEDLQISPSAFVCLNLPNWSATGWPTSQAFYVPGLWFGDENMQDANVLVPALLQNNWDNCSLYATEKPFAYCGFSIAKFLPFLFEFSELYTPFRWNSSTIC